MKLLETPRLTLRKFRPEDLEALFQLLHDKEVNRFLPWFPVETLEEAQAFYRERIQGQRYFFAICLKGEDRPIGYVQAEDGDSYDFGYGLRTPFWHHGFMREAAQAVVDRIAAAGYPYITATHDRNNPRSGAVMRAIGMHYCYSYEEQWQPKNIPVIFRMYQLNFDPNDAYVYQKYWEQSAVRFIESCEP